MVLGEFIFKTNLQKLWRDYGPVLWQPSSLSSLYRHPCAYRHGALIFLRPPFFYFTFSGTATELPVSVSIYLLLSKYLESSSGGANWVTTLGTAVDPSCCRQGAIQRTTNHARGPVFLAACVCVYVCVVDLPVTSAPLRFGYVKPDL